MAATNWPCLCVVHHHHLMIFLIFFFSLFHLKRRGFACVCLSACVCVCTFSEHMFYFMPHAFPSQTHFNVIYLEKVPRDCFVEFVATVCQVLNCFALHQQPTGFRYQRRAGSPVTTKFLNYHVCLSACPSVCQNVWWSNVWPFVLTMRSLVSCGLFSHFWCVSCRSLTLLFSNACCFCLILSAFILMSFSLLRFALTCEFV